jgi:hypothetical protein
MESFRSKAEALQYIEAGKEGGRYLNCGNLLLADELDLRRGTIYHPGCRENSLGVSGGYDVARTTYCPEGAISS